MMSFNCPIYGHLHGQLMSLARWSIGLGPARLTPHQCTGTSMGLFLDKYSIDWMNEWLLHTKSNLSLSFGLRFEAIELPFVFSSAQLDFTALYYSFIPLHFYYTLLINLKQWTLKRAPKNTQLLPDSSCSCALKVIKRKKRQRVVVIII